MLKKELMSSESIRARTITAGTAFRSRAGSLNCADHCPIRLEATAPPTRRLNIRCFTRLTNAVSKKLENHAFSVALHSMHYNFCRIHKTLRVTPAMAAGVTDRVWDMSDIAALIAAREAPVAKRGPYKKKAA